MVAILNRKFALVVVAIASLIASEAMGCPAISNSISVNKNSTFTLYTLDGHPILWDKNRTIEVVIEDLDRQEANRILVVRSLRWLEIELGIKSRIIGVTTIPASRLWFQSRSFGRIPPVNISFVRRRDSDLLRDPTAIAATVANPSRGLKPRIVTGAIAIDQFAFDALSSDKKELVLRHELGHLIGFGHDFSDVMNPNLGGCSSRSLSRSKVIRYLAAERDK